MFSCRLVCFLQLSLCSFKLSILSFLADIKEEETETEILSKKKKKKPKEVTFVDDDVADLESKGIILIYVFMENFAMLSLSGW